MQEILLSITTLFTINTVTDVIKRFFPKNKFQVLYEEFPYSSSLILHNSITFVRL